MSNTSLLGSFGGQGDSSLMFRNKVINGDMRIAQRGTSITSASAPYVYSLDRWRFYGQVTTGSATVSQQAFTAGQTDVPNEPEFFMRWNQTATPGGTVALTQPIEGVRTFAGQTATISFWAKAGSARSITVRLTQNFGSGGSADVSTNSSAQALTTSWQRYTITLSVPSISGKTIGANNYLDLMFVDSNASTFTIDLAEIQAEAGPVSTPFERRPIGVETLLAMRYYVKTAYCIHGYSVPNAATNSCFNSPSFPVPMRITPPTITMGNQADGGTYTSLVIDRKDAFGFRVSWTTGAGFASFFGYTADAEL